MVQPVRRTQPQRSASQALSGTRNAPFLSLGKTLLSSTFARTGRGGACVAPQDRVQRAPLDPSETLGRHARGPPVLQQRGRVLAPAQRRV